MGEPHNDKFRYTWQHEHMPEEVQHWALDTFPILSFEVNFPKLWIFFCELGS